ncbi:MAG: flagellar assembly protein FliW [Deltaproteobacteria bacterium]|nr:flagellar assembly protein FliW [Deltaproteobacteria bacterium]
MVAPLENKTSRASYLTISTRDLGPRQVDEEAVISFPTGLPGFEDYRRFVLLQYPFPTPLVCLQCIDRPEVAFVVTDPVNLVADFKLTPGNSDLPEWRGEDPKDIKVLVILTIPPGCPRDLTANLMAPLVINLRTRRGRQVVVDKGGYSSKHPVLVK